MKKIIVICVILVVPLTNLLAQTNYEAEGSNATLSGNTIIQTFNNQQAAFFNGNSPNERIIFNFNIANSSEYEIIINYGMPSGYGNKNQIVKINNASLGSLTFNNSNGGYSDKSLGNQLLNSGSNTVEIQADWGYMYINRITLLGNEPQTFAFEAEDAQLTGNVIVSSFSGESTAFINGNTSNDRMSFSFDVASSGQYDFKINYGMPASYSSKNQYVSVNGSSLGSISFSNSGGSLVTKDMGQISLNSGSNNIEIQAHWGYMHVNWISITGPDEGGTGCPGAPAGVEGFFTAEGKLWDANCNEFVIRGINHQYGDHVNSIPASMKGAIPQMRSVGKANAVRIQLRHDANDGQGITSANDIMAAVDLCVENDMVPILMMYSNSATCGNNVSALEAAVDRWTQLASSSEGDLDTYQNFRKYGIINVTNEFGINNSPGFSSWKNAYKNAISSIRNAGYTNPIMIDAHQCAQDINVFLGSDGGGVSRAQELLDHDPLHNVIFSAHAYNWLWNTNEKIINQIDDMATSGFNWVFGEHGNTAFEAPNDDVNNFLLWQKCEEANPKIGWIAWAWCSGNGSCCTALNMSGAWVPNNFNDLLPYGKDVVSNQFGLENTAEIASVFNNTNAALPIQFNEDTPAEPLSEVLSSFSVYPNPFKNEFILEGLEIGEYKATIYDLHGKAQFTTRMHISGSKALVVDQLKNGVYLLKITGNNFSEHRRIIRK